MNINNSRRYQAARHPIRFFSSSSELFCSDEEEKNPRGRTSPVNNTKCTVSIKVKRKVAQPDFPGGSNNAYATQNQVTCPLRLDPEDMFYPGTNPGSCPVTLLFPFAQLAVAGSLALNMFSVPVLFSGALSSPAIDKPNPPTHHGCCCPGQAVRQRRCCHGHWQELPCSDE